MARTGRQLKLIEIINKNEIETQEALAEALRNEGYLVTQATVSRDIKDLGLIKLPVQGGGSVYAVSQISEQDSDRQLNMFSDAVLDIDCALHTVVIKTYAGMAQAVAASVDALMKNEFLGSVAGDDTVLIIAASPESAADIAEKLRKTFSSK